MKGLKVLMCSLLISMFALTACEQKGPAEELGEKIDDAATDVGNAIEDACEDIKDAADAKDKNC